MRVTLNGHVFRTTLARYSGQHYLGFNQAMRTAAGITIGERIEVLIAVDREPRVIAPPDDLAAALDASPTALERWERLSYSHRKAYVEAIEQAKKPETRARRIQETIAALSP